MFNQLTKGLQSDVYILNGLLFEINNSYFQIDTLLIAPQKLMAAHQNEYPFSKYPPYQFDQLKKGKMCAMCHSLSTFQRDRRLVCNDCGHEEAIEAAFLRAVTELRLLFPDRKITTNLVYEWCGEDEGEGGSRKRVVRILRKNLGAKGYGRWVYYE